MIMADRIRVEVDDSLEGLIPGYLSDIGEWIIKIQDFMEKKDFDAIRNLTHKMAGTGAGYGFDFITRAGNEANKAAKGKDPVLVREWMEKLKEYLDRLDIIYVDDDSGFDF
jgi:hypothetical protein